jgi:hypothetical protein
MIDPARRIQSELVPPNIDQILPASPQDMADNTTIGNLIKAINTDPMSALIVACGTKD